MKPLAIDLFSGLGGWTDGLLSAGWDVVGFDITRHTYAVPEDIRENEAGHKNTNPMEKRGWSQGCAVSLGMEGAESRPRTRILQYPAQLVLQDVLTIDGRQFKDAALIVASPPCQAYSWLALPWSRSKDPNNSKKAKELRRKWETEGPDNRLFDACFRIQREASEASGRHIPMVVENVRGAVPWVGPAKANYGSFYLWGDVAMVGNRIIAGPVQFGAGQQVGLAQKIGGGGWFERDANGQTKQDNYRAGVRKGVGRGETMEDGTGATSWFGTNRCDPRDSRALALGVKVPSEEGRRTDVGNGARFTSRDCGVDAAGTKIGGDWFSDPQSTCRKHGSRSNARKAASAMIAKIPFPLAEYIGKAFLPANMNGSLAQGAGPRAAAGKS